MSKKVPPGREHTRAKPKRSKTGELPAREVSKAGQRPAEPEPSGREVSKSGTRLLPAEAEADFKPQEGTFSGTSSLTGIGRISENTQSNIARLDTFELSANRELANENYGEAARLYRRAIEVVELLPGFSPSREAQLYARLALICERQDRQSEAAKLIDEGRKALSADDPEFKEARFSLDSLDALIVSRQGHNELAVHMLLEMIEKVKALPMTTELAFSVSQAHFWLANGLANIGDQRAVPQLLEGIRIAHHAGLGAIETTGRLNLADYYTYVKQMDAARTQLAQARTLLAAEDHDNLSYALATEARIDLIAATPESAAKARALIEKAFAEAERVDAKWNLSSLNADMARALLTLGQAEEARPFAEAARQHARNDPFKRGSALQVLGQVELARGKPELAKKSWTDALALFQTLGDRSLAADVQGLMARL